MRKDIAEALVDELSSFAEAEIYEDYSGRGMYGRTTTGVVTGASQGEFIMALVEVARELDEIEPREFQFATDSMGRDTIYY